MTVVQKSLKETSMSTNEPFWRSIASRRVRNFATRSKLDFCVAHDSNSAAAEVFRTGCAEFEI